jgi:hypothetical protein
MCDKKADLISEVGFSLLCRARSLLFEPRLDAPQILLKKRAPVV